MSKKLFQQWIIIEGAREHNLKNVTVAIPKNTLTVITGPSGSGKSSLALDILYTEGKRRYMESLSSYARQFLGIARKPDFDRIDGLCPAIAIDQKTVGSNPRSTVGTITEIYDYLRVLFARIGTAECPDCKIAIKPQSPEGIMQTIVRTFQGKTITIAAPLAHEKKGEFTQTLLQLYHKGLYRFIIDGTSYRFKSEQEIKDLKLGKTYKHTIDCLLDQVEVNPADQARISEAVEHAFQLAQGFGKVIVGTQEYRYSSKSMCLQCSKAFPELEPRLFSFNSPIGACKECHGLGIIHEWPWKAEDADAWKSNYPDFFGKYAQEHQCSSCKGQRLNPYALAVTIQHRSIAQLGNYSIDKLLAFFNALTLTDQEVEIAQALLKEIKSRLKFLSDVGLYYLSLGRTARTLSGGEGQRIRLATQIGSALSGVLYVLDEPSIGLHQRDNDRLIETLKYLRDLGNTVVVVEHDLDTMKSSDYIVDMGPAAGILGGKVVAYGTPPQVEKNPHSITGPYLSGKKTIPLPSKLRNPTGYITVKHAHKNNLKDLTVSFPLGVFCTVTGVSGSGKSTLVMEHLVPQIEYSFTGSKKKGPHENIEGADQLDAMVVIDQTPIGRTPRSNPATYLGIFDDIRQLYASLPESNARGFKVGRFSFNVEEGRCFECRGDGTVTVSMQFLADVIMTCKRCHGSRYNHETLSITYKGKNIAQVLAMTALEALTFFSAHKNIAKRLQLLCDVGLDYIALGQSSTTLSGGEAQRIKLVHELAKRGNKTLYVLDEPTTGLHSADIEKLLVVLNRLIDKGNSMVVIEHNLDVIKTSDYVIDLGPEGGDQGGTLVGHGTPSHIAKLAKSYTGQYLKKLLS